MPLVTTQNRARPPRIVRVTIVFWASALLPRVVMASRTEVSQTSTAERAARFVAPPGNDAMRPSIASVKFATPDTANPLVLTVRKTASRATSIVAQPVPCVVARALAVQWPTIAPVACVSKGIVSPPVQTCSSTTYWVKPTSIAVELFVRPAELAAIVLSIRTVRVRSASLVSAKSLSHVTTAHSTQAKVIRTVEAHAPFVCPVRTV